MDKYLKALPMILISTVALADNGHTVGNVGMRSVGMGLTINLAILSYYA